MIVERWINEVGVFLYLSSHCEKTVRLYTHIYNFSPHINERCIDLGGANMTLFEYSCYRLLFVDVFKGSLIPPSNHLLNKKTRYI